MVLSSASHLAAQHPTLLQRGQGLAFAGLLIGGVSAFVTRKGRQGLRETSPGLSQGRYFAMMIFAVPMLGVGLVGVVMMAVALSR